MQIVRYTYTSTDVEDSVFLLLYLRMNGIYVYERFFDMDMLLAKRMISPIQKNAEGEMPKEFDQFDMDLVWVNDEQEAEKVRFLSYSRNLFLIVEEGFSNSITTIESKQMIIYKEGAGNRANVLYDLNRRMLENGLISTEKCRCLDASARIYCNKDIMKLFFTSKYFYEENDTIQLEQTKMTFRDIVDEIFREINDAQGTWGDEDTLYLQYAAIDMAYEGNLYCKKNKEPLLYTPESLRDVCEILLRNKKAKYLLGQSISMLLAQIYDDLIGDLNEALRHYLPACGNYNSYAFFRKALHYQDAVGDIDKAINYYEKSVWIYPWYYRAWHMMGICYTMLEEWENALWAFENVGLILNSRLNSNKIRPMEIEYLFKAMNQCGYIWSKKCFDLYQAIEAYSRAELAWNAIFDTEFISCIYGADDCSAKNMRERLQKELNVKTIYRELGKLYVEVGNLEKAEEYLKKGI